MGVSCTMVALGLRSSRMVIPVTSRVEASTVSEKVRKSSEVFRLRSNPMNWGDCISLV